MKDKVHPQFLLRCRGIARIPIKKIYFSLFKEYGLNKELIREVLKKDLMKFVPRAGRYKEKYKL